MTSQRNVSVFLTFALCLCFVTPPSYAAVPTVGRSSSEPSGYIAITITPEIATTLKSPCGMDWRNCACKCRECQVFRSQVYAALKSQSHILQIAIANVGRCGCKSKASSDPDSNVNSNYSPSKAMVFPVSMQVDGLGQSNTGSPEIFDEHLEYQLSDPEQLPPQ